MTRAEGLTRTIDRLERELTNTRGELSILQRECRHDFTNPVYHPYVQEGYIPREIDNADSPTAEQTFNAIPIPYDRSGFEALNSHIIP